MHASGFPYAAVDFPARTSGNSGNLCPLWCDSRFAKGAVMEHGGKGDAAQVGFLTKGLATFSCLDVQSQTHIFALLAPGRALGDLDALNPHRVAVQVDFIRPSSVLIVPRARFLESLRASVE